MEVVYKDGSTSTFNEGRACHAGDLAIERIRLITAKSALEFYLKFGREITRDGSWAAVMNVIAPLSGRDYTSGASKRLTKKGKADALADCKELIAMLEHEAVVYEED